MKTNYVRVKRMTPNAHTHTHTRSDSEYLTKIQMFNVKCEICLNLLAYHCINAAA